MFRLEKEMLPIIEDGLSNKRNDIKIFREFNSGNGITDLTIAEGGSFIPEFTVQDYTEMYYLVNFFNDVGAKISPTELQTKNNLNKKKLESLINKLLANGIIKKKNSYYIVRRQYRPAIKRIFSVEAKIKNWKDGYYQALRYKCFSHKCYIALSSKYIENVKIELLLENNIGLISVNRNSIKIIINPQIEDPTDVVSYYHLAENMVCSRSCSKD